MNAKYTDTQTFRCTHTYPTRTHEFSQLEDVQQVAFNEKVWEGSRGNSGSKW